MNRKDKERHEDKMVSMRDWAKKPALGGFESTCIQVPEGFKMIKLPSEGIVKWDFMPYRAGKYNRRADEGYLIGELEYEAHRVPVAEGKTLYLCTVKMGIGPCAVCDWLKKHGGTADPKLAKELRQTTTRHLWVVNDKPGDENNPLKIFDNNHFNKKKGFGEQLADAINTLDEGDNPIAFKGGYTVVITCAEDTFPGGKYTLATRIDLRPRKYDYNPSIVKKAPCLDECLIIPDYDEVWGLLEIGPTVKKTEEKEERNGRGRHDDDEEEARRPAARSRTQEPDDDDDKKKADDDDEGDERTAEDFGIEVGDEVTYRGGDYKVKKISPDGTTLTLENADDEDDIERGIAPNLVKLSDRKPAGKTKPAAKDDDDEDDDDKPARRKPTAKDDDDDEGPEDKEEDDDLPSRRSTSRKGR